MAPQDQPLGGSSSDPSDVLLVRTPTPPEPEMLPRPHLEPDSSAQHTPTSEAAAAPRAHAAHRPFLRRRSVGSPMRDRGSDRGSDRGDGGEGSGSLSARSYSTSSATAAEARVVACRSPVRARARLYLLALRREVGW